jgi:folate-binding Fe-S cluster repair protein YgfZ
MTETCIFHGPAAACLHLYGADALRFAQSQFSARIEAPSLQRWSQGYWLDAHGKVLAESAALALAPESVLLWSFECPSEILKDAVMRHRVADEVELQDLSQSLHFSHIPLSLRAKPGLAALLPESGGVAGDARSHAEGWALDGDETEVPSLLLLGKTEAEQERLRQLLEACAPDRPIVRDFASPEWQRRRIDAGVAAFPADFAPNAALWVDPCWRRWVDLKKGCFTGREMAAAFARKSQFPMQLQRVQWQGLPIAQPLPVPVEAEGMDAGWLCSLASAGPAVDGAAGTQAWVGMALLRSRHLDKTLLLGTEQAPPLRLRGSATPQALEVQAGRDSA